MGEISFNPVFGIWSKSSNLYKPCFQGKLPMESTQQMFVQGKKERGGREEGNPNSHKSFIRKVTHQRDCHKSFCHHMLINRGSQLPYVRSTAWTTQRCSQSYTENRRGRKETEVARRIKGGNQKERDRSSQ